MRSDTRREPDGSVTYLRLCADWLDFVSYAERIEQDSYAGLYNHLPCSSLKVDDGRNAWSGTRTLPDAIKIARTGWHDGRMKLESFRNQLGIERLIPSRQRISRVYMNAGDEVDIDRYLAGEPEDMVVMNDHRILTRDKVVRFIFSRSASCLVATDSIIWRGLAYLIAIEALILLGYSVEIVIVMCVTATSETRNRYEVQVPILHAGDPVNIDTLAFMLLHPSVLRRLCFAVEEYEPEHMRRTFGFHVGGDYGRPEDPLTVAPGDHLCPWNDGLQLREGGVVLYASQLLARVDLDILSDSDSEW